MHDYIIYCDGACSGNPGPGGWGGILIEKESFIREYSGSHPSTTNNRMELIGAISVLAVTPEGSETLILTDSVYVIRGITEWIFGWKKKNWKTSEGGDVLNKDLWIELNQLVNKRKVLWRYVRGHAGNPGNERVDEIAVAARDGKYANLFEGKMNLYSVPVLPLPPFEDLPKSFGSVEKKEVFCYLSYLDGKLELHKTWKDCEARVKGRSGAKFKKANSEGDVAKIKKEWGV